MFLHCYAKVNKKLCNNLFATISGTVEQVQQSNKVVMKRVSGFLFFTVFLLVKGLHADAQSMAGITGIRDTSYSMNSAWAGTLKTNPEARLVIPADKNSYTEELNRTYTKIGSRALQLDVFRPKAGKSNNIAILFIHGGGWRTGNRSQHHELARHLAALGYTCFTPAYRLSTEALFPAAVYDLKAAIRWVKENAATYKIDSSRVVASGFSAGGELAAFLGVTGNLPLFEGTITPSAISTSVAAVIDIDGILSFTHPESGEGDDSKRTSAATYWFGYPRKGNEQLWNTASSLSYAGPYTPPTLFLNSSVARMHAGREDYISILKQYGIYTEVHEFDKAPHGFCMFEPWFTPTVQYMDAFLKKVFKR
jgi:pectinesterase